MSRFSAQDLKNFGLIEHEGKYITKALYEKIQKEKRAAMPKKPKAEGTTAKKLPKKGTEEHTKSRVYWKYMNVIDIFENCKRNREIWIPGNVPSSKNAKEIKQIFVSHAENNKRIAAGKKPIKTRPIISESDLCQEYRKKISHYFEQQRNDFLKLIESKQAPYRVHFKLIRNIDNGWDFGNICQILQDLMQEYKWLPNDSHKYLVPVYDKPEIDVENPGVIIWVE